mmetsp:Transcript_2391/g.5651  ORF Transcript_2391/g.5651 Transcript_2391/m.5651 type:complete len:208 (+) Transcript_2391:85-708(+)
MLQLLSTSTRLRLGSMQYRSTCSNRTCCTCVASVQTLANAGFPSKFCQISKSKSAYIGFLQGRTTLQASAPGGGAPVDAGTSGEIANVITCREIMTKGEVVVCHPDTPVAEALETLGTRKLTGMPVMDRATGALVGVVSDFDLLSLEDIAGRAEGGGDIFPATGESWLAFKAVKNLLDKQAGKTVQDVMTPNPVTVTPDTSLEEAAR